MSARAHTILLIAGLVAELMLFPTASAAPWDKLYVEPTTGEKARIRIISDGDVRIATNACSTSDVSSWEVALSNQSAFLSKDNNGKSLGLPPVGTPPKELITTELYIPAGQPVLFNHVFLFSDGFNRYNCQGNYAFVPEAGRDYQGVFRQSPDHRSCIRFAFEISAPSVRFNDISGSKDCVRK